MGVLNSLGSEIRPGNREAEVQPWCWFGRTAQNWDEYKLGESIKTVHSIQTSIIQLNTAQKLMQKLPR